MPRIRFQPSNTTIDPPPGVTLAAAVRAAGFHLPTPCGGKGLCGKCRVRVLAGDIAADAGQRRCLPERLLADGWRASCIVHNYPDLTLADPEPEEKSAILTDFAGRDVSALPDPAGSPPGPGPDPGLGLAVDLGTTTLAAVLCDMRTGAALAVVSRANPQSLRGDDVISRIDYAARGDAELRELRLLAVDAIEAMGGEALRRIGRESADLRTVAIAGNTVMNHLLLDVDPSPLAVSPFVPRFLVHDPVDAADIGWSARPAPCMHIIPNVAAYVGGDITAGVLAHDVAENPGTVLFLDIGTNGEIVLRANGTTYACATAAGPAFEGARIAQGMRAAPGAICRVDVTPDGDIDIGVVDGTEAAKGICGTGLLDAAAALRALGAIDETGRLLDAGEARDAALPPLLCSRLYEDDAGPAVRLCPPGDASPGVSLTQRDIRELQLAKGAIAAGVRVLLGVAGIAPEAVDEVLLAGGFGAYLRPESALGVGILPAGIRLDNIRSVGNASLAGARLCLISQQERRRAAMLSAAIKYVELSGREDFQIAFAEEMLFY